MTIPVGGTGSGAHDEVLAGEYVLGALPADTARLVEARLKTDRQFAAMVRRWQENLSDIEEADADPWLAAGKIRDGGLPDRADFAMPNRNVWQSFAFWRGFGLAIICLLGIYALFELQNSGGSPATSRVPVLSAVYDAATGRVTLASGKASAEPLRIWAIDKTGQAHPIGELRDNGSLVLEEPAKALLADGASLAVAPAH